MSALLNEFILPVASAEQADTHDVTTTIPHQFLGFHRLCPSFRAEADYCISMYNIGALLHKPPTTGWAADFA
jgi:hypothetical protein